MGQVFWTNLDNSIRATKFKKQLKTFTTVDLNYKMALNYSHFYDSIFYFLFLHLLITLLILFLYQTGATNLKSN